MGILFACSEGACVWGGGARAVEEVFEEGCGCVVCTYITFLVRTVEYFSVLARWDTNFDSCVESKHPVLTCMLLFQSDALDGVAAAMSVMSAARLGVSLLSIDKGLGYRGSSFTSRVL